MTNITFHSKEYLLLPNISLPSDIIFIPTVDGTSLANFEAIDSDKRPLAVYFAQNIERFDTIT